MNTIKLHNPLIAIVNTALDSIFNQQIYADKEVQRILKSNKQLGSKDRSFVAETVYDIVRWKQNYAEFIPTEEQQIDNFNGYIYLSLLQRGFTILNVELLNINTASFKDRLDITNTVAEARMSFPKWIDERCFSELAENWSPIAVALNITAKTYIRINPLKTTKEKIIALFEKENIEIRQIETTNPINTLGLQHPYCIEIISKNNLKNSAFYKDGLFEFQDLGSQLIGIFCGVKQHQTVLDICAGAGGKTLHLSALMHNRGKIIATDFNATRTTQLTIRAKQAGCKNIQLIEFDLIKNYTNVDVLLIDAPCSGLGIIRRNPDVKWKLKETDIQHYCAVQAALLEDYKHLIAPNGKIIYATCSILPTENELQIQHFLGKNPDFYLEKEIRLSPNLYDTDGYYMAEIRRR